MSTVGLDAATSLLRALRSSFETVSFMNFEQVRSREWASVTFTGARHQLAIRLGGPGAEAAADRFAAGLDTIEFRLRGHILADIALTGRERMPDGVRLELEALTVEAC
jgi:hypothetical protein